MRPQGKPDNGISVHFLRTEDWSVILGFAKEYRGEAGARRLLWGMYVLPSSEAKGRRGSCR